MFEKFADTEEDAMIFVLYAVQKNHKQQLSKACIEDF